MASTNSIVAWLREAQRRGVFKIAVMYIVCAWLMMQIADVFFPAWNIPDAALRPLLRGAVLGLPVALVFGWIYDVSMSGIRRTPALDSDPAMVAPLRPLDYGTLGALSAFLAFIIYGVVADVLQLKNGMDLSVSVSSDKPANSVAVLPFSNLSEDASNEIFCDGLSEEILHRLSDYRDMHVLARQSSFAFKGAEIDVPRLSEVLGVRYLLQGSVRRDGKDLRISAQLVDESGRQLWSESYDREMTGIFAIQTEIAASVANSLADTIAASRVDPRNYEPDVDAYQHYLIGREYLRSRTGGYQNEAIKHFERAIAIDPAYPEPYAGHAIVLLLDQRDAARHFERFEEAKVLIERALSLDPDLALGHAAQGLYLQMKKPPSPKESEVALRKALEVDPFLPVVRGAWLFNALVSQGLLSEARAERDRALTRNPLDPRLAANAAVQHARGGDYNTAETQLRRLLDLPQPPGLVFTELRRIYDSQGRFADLIEIMKQAILAHASPESEAFMEFSLLALGYAHLGMWEEADHWQHRAEVIAPVEPGTVLRRGLIFKLQGDIEKMKSEVAALIDALGFDPERLPPWIGGIMGVIEGSTGNAQRGIMLMESSIDWEDPDPNDLTIDIMQFLAFAHQQLGNGVRAEEVLDFAGAALKRREQGGEFQPPGSLGLIFQNHAVARNTDAALDALETAIEAGWRDYFYIINDHRWTWLHDNARFRSLMRGVKSDIDAQRARVEKTDAEQDFGALLDQRAKTRLSD